MAKVIRKRLARGTKIVPGHVFDPIDDAASPGIGYQVNNNALEKENLANKTVPFRISLNIPFIDSKFAQGTGETPRFFTIPFILPPLQDTFSYSTHNGINYPGVTAAKTPATVFLDEISIGFDQRAEPAAIVDNWYDTDATLSAAGLGSSEGDLNFDEQGKLNLRVAVFQKLAKFFNPSAPIWPNELIGFDVPYTYWVADGPFVIKGLNKTIDPYKTYAVGIYAPDLPDSDLAIPNICINLKFRHELVPRDSGSDIQNIPIKSRSAQSRAAAGQTISITAPAPDTLIEADTPDGVSENLGIIDEALAERFRGGIDKYGEAPPYQELLDDSGYEVIAVPLMGNRRRGGISVYDVVLEPYMRKNLGAALFDRRIIPLVNPLCIHHVVLAYNWQTWNNVYSHGISAPTTYLPQSANFTVDVGVGIGTGLKGDNFTYDQIASVQLVNPYAYGGTAGNPTAGASWFTKVIDFVKTTELSGVRNYSMVSTVSVTPDALSFWDWDIMSVPLVGAGGVGYATQGHPVYVGRSWTPTAVTAAYANDRQNIGGGAPNCVGQEQFIEVRMKISDSGGLYLGGTSMSTQNYISGYGGHWVYLICKKMMT